MESESEKEKRSGQPDSNQRPKEIHDYYSPPLYQLSYARIQDEREQSVYVMSEVCDRKKRRV